MFNMNLQFFAHKKGVSIFSVFIHLHYIVT